MNAPVVIAHVGLHKTGSTTLQRDIFPMLPGVRLVRGFETIRNILSSSSQRPDPVLLFSDEAVSARPGWSPQFASLDSFVERLRLFHCVFAPSRYVIAFRTHSTWIRSMYCQYLHEGETGQIKDFFSLENGGLLQLGESPWRRRYDYLAHCVGSRNVFVYLQEDLLISPKLVIPQLIQFLLSASAAPATELNPLFGADWENYRRNVSGRLEGYPTLRRINQLIQPFRRLRIRKKLSQLLERLSLTPRQLCQNSQLPRLWGHEMGMDDIGIDEYYAEDLAYVRARARESYQFRWQTPRLAAG